MTKKAIPIIKTTANPTIIRQKLLFKYRIFYFLKPTWFFR